MKVLLINGSARKNGNTYRALKEVSDTLVSQGIETEIYQIKNNQHGCLHCHYCHVDGHVGCVYKDDGVNDILVRLDEFDGFVFGAPVYSGGPSGALKAFIDRLKFCCKEEHFAYKAGAAIVTGRRGALSESYHDLIRSMTGTGHMNVIGSSSYCNVHGSGTIAEEVYEDKEGMQTMRNLGLNMAYYLKMRECAKLHGIEQPKPKRHIFYDFAKSEAYYKV